MNVNCLNVCLLIGKCNVFYSKRIFSTLQIIGRNGVKTFNSPLLQLKGSRLSVNSNLWNPITTKCLSSVKTSVYYEKNNQKDVTKCLMQSFGLEIEEVENIYKNYPDLQNVAVADLKNNISYLELEQLISTELATKRSWVLFSDKLSLSYGIRALNSFRLLDQIRVGKTHILVVFLANKSRFDAICKRIAKSEAKLFSDFDQRMDLFCNELEINCQMFCSIVSQNFQLVIKNIDHIKSVMQLLKNNGVSNTDLITDHWIFMHNIQFMEKRIQECKATDQPIRPWNLRCPDKIWYPLLQTRKENVKALGKENSTRSYLMNLLNCNNEDIEHMIYKNNNLLAVQPKKLKQMIAFLQKSGYTSSEIMRVPRVLNHSYERVRKRVTDKRFKNRKPNLGVIFLPEIDYKELVEMQNNSYKCQSLAYKC